MKYFLEKAKNEYNSIEIPSELNDLVESALNKGENNKHYRRPLVYRYISIAACFFLCAVICVGYFATSQNNFDTDDSETEKITVANERSTDYEITCDSAVEEASASKRNTKAVARANGSEITELYSDDEIFSYSVTAQLTNTINYHNVCRSNGEEIKIESLLGEDSKFNSSNSTFYFKSKNELVVICNGLKNYVTLK